MRSHATAGAVIHRHVDAKNLLVDFYRVIVLIKTIHGIYVCWTWNMALCVHRDWMWVWFCNKSQCKTKFVFGAFLFAILVTCVLIHFFQILQDICWKLPPKQILAKNKQKQNVIKIIKLYSKSLKQKVHSFHFLTRSICWTETCHYLALCCIPASFPPL